MGKGSPSGDGPKKFEGLGNFQIRTLYKTKGGFCRHNQDLSAGVLGALEGGLGDSEFRTIFFKEDERVLCVGFGKWAQIQLAVGDRLSLMGTLLSFALPKNPEEKYS